MITNKSGCLKIVLLLALCGVTLCRKYINLRNIDNICWPHFVRYLRLSEFTVKTKSRNAYIIILVFMQLYSTSVKKFIILYFQYLPTRAPNFLLLMHFCFYLFDFSDMRFIIISLHRVASVDLIQFCI